MNGIVKGSISDIAKQNGQSIAQTFISCDVICIVDTSASMGMHDAPGGRTRYDQACNELANLQGSLPGKIGVISFSDRVMFCADGVPFNFSSTTNLAAALTYAQIADIPNSHMRFIVISDGQPDSEMEALSVARKYHNRIDTIFCGPENGMGRDFLARLAAASGGSHVTTAQAAKLADGVTKLLVA